MGGSELSGAGSCVSRLLIDHNPSWRASDEWSFVMFCGILAHQNIAKHLNGQGTTTPWRIGHIFLIRILSIFRSLVQLQSKFDQVLQVLLRQRRAYLIYMDKESNVDYKTSRCKVTCLIQISCCFGYGISLQMPFQMPSPQRKRLLHWYRFDRLIDTRSAEGSEKQSC